MNTIHKTLHLQHHRHTGKVLHHRHTSYRGLAVVLVLAGSVIIGLNMLAKATADSLFVYATIPAPIPTSSALITFPVDGATFTSPQQTISGTCPATTPHVIVSIINNGQQAGSVACDNANKFSIPVTLTLENHTIVAKVTSITGDSGPDSSPLHLTYLAPVAQEPSSTSPTGGSTLAPGSASGSGQISAISSLVLNPTDPFIVYGPARDAIWTGTISGGISPYRVHINWGDGSHNDYFADGTTQTFHHHFDVMQAYDVTFRVTDKNGDSYTEHFAAATPYIPPASIGGTIETVPGPLSAPELFGAYGTYLLLLAIFGAIWARSHPFIYAKVPLDHRTKLARQRYAAAKRRQGRGSSQR